MSYIPEPWSFEHLAALCSGCSNFSFLCCHCRSSLLSKVIIIYLSDISSRTIWLRQLPVCRCQTRWRSRAGLLCWFCDRTGYETPENRIYLQAIKLTWTQHLGEIIEKGISSLFAEVHLGQGEKAGLLLDNITAIFTLSLPSTVMNHPHHWLDFDSLKYVLAIASFDAAPLRTVVGKSLEQSLCLVLVLKDAPVAKIINGQLSKQISPYFPVCSSSWTEAARGSPSKTLAIIVIRTILTLKQLWNHPKVPGCGL